MAEAYLGDQKRILPCAAFVDGQYGLDGLYVGVPVQIGAGGVEKIVEIELDDADKAGLQVSIDEVKELLDACKAVVPSLHRSPLAEPGALSWAGRVHPGDFEVVNSHDKTQITHQPRTD